MSGADCAGSLLSLAICWKESIDAHEGRKRTSDPRRRRNAHGRDDAPLLAAGAVVVGAAGAGRRARSRAAARRGPCRLPRRPTGGSASSTSSARIAARRCGSAATRRTACAASITAGSSTSTGQCVDQMNEPRQFCDKVRVTAYPTCEIGGVVWTYMGPPDKQPAPPKFAWTQAPETHRAVSKVIEECNWLQALEGGIDTSHFTILHRALKLNARQPGVEPDSPGRARRRADARGRCHRLRLSLFRHPSARRSAIRSRLSLRHAVHAAASARTGQEAGPRPLLGPDGRRELHGVELLLQLWRGADR